VGDATICSHYGLGYRKVILSRDPVVRTERPGLEQVPVSCGKNMLGRSRRQRLAKVPRLFSPLPMIDEVISAARKLKKFDLVVTDTVSLKYLLSDCAV
jgi:hypothetical protein